MSKLFSFFIKKKTKAKSPYIGKNDNHKEKKEQKYESHLKTVKKMKIKHTIKIILIVLLILVVTCLIATYRYNKRFKKLSFENLTYNIDKKYKLTHDEETSRTYKYNNCEIKIFFEEKGDNSIDNYFHEIVDAFETEKLKIKQDEIILNGNKWKYLEIKEEFENEMTNKSSYQTKYMYHSIIIYGKMYNISFYNPEFDYKCTEKYDIFTKTLDFK